TAGWCHELNGEVGSRVMIKRFDGAGDPAAVLLATAHVSDADLHVRQWDVDGECRVSGISTLVFDAHDEGLRATADHEGHGCDVLDLEVCCVRWRRRKQESAHRQSGCDAGSKQRRTSRGHVSGPPVLAARPNVSRLYAALCDAPWRGD